MFDLDEETINTRLQLLTSDLRTGELDHRLDAYIAKIQNPDAKRIFHMMGLLAYMYREPRHRAIAVRPPGRIYPDAKVVDLLYRFGLEEQLCAYLCRFPRPYSGKVARAFEFLQASKFHDQKGHSNDWSKLSLAHELNHFRLAQKLRNENGFTRSKSPSGCFRSFEDIVNLERSSEGGDVTPVIVQCCQLKIVGGQHMKYMNRCAVTFPQLLTVYNAVTTFGKKTLRLGEPYCFERRFEWLSNELPEASPPWAVLKVYLKTKSHVDEIFPAFFTYNIRNSELNEALNCLLNRFQVCSLKYTLDPIAVLALLLPMLFRDADLYYRHPDEEMSSIAALVKTAQNDGSVYIVNYDDFMCCPLAEDAETEEVIPNSNELTSLFCLCARKLPPSPPIEWSKRMLVEAHTELQAVLDRRPYTPPGRESGWEIDTSVFFGEYIYFENDTCALAKKR